MNAPSEREWLERYRRWFIDVAKLTPTQAQGCANAEEFAVLSEGYEDDPEGAAEMEFSYWDGE